MSRSASAYNQVIQMLQKLHKMFPSYNMGRHLSMAMDGYGDMWNVTDKEMLFALKKYATHIESDVQDLEMDKILKEGMDLDHILDTSEEEE